MKKRIAKKLDKRPLSMRNFNKYMFLTFSIQDYWSTKVKNKCYIRTNDGRVMIYSEVLSNGSHIKGEGYYLWNDDTMPSWND